MVEYYNKRAATMDEGYRQEPSGWVLDLIADMQEALRDRRVLEVACGTGHWTRFAAQAAASITGIDAAPNMLAVARAKAVPGQLVQLRLGDAYTLADVPGEFDAGLAMQWFSHVPQTRHTEFLAGLHERIGPGGVVFLADNQDLDGMADKPYRKPGHADTYECRRLPGCDGYEREAYEIVKNYFTAADLRDILAPYGTDLTITSGTYWWWLHYRLPT